MNAQQYSMLSKCAESFTTWVVVVQFLVMLAMWNCIATPLAENKNLLIITMIQLPNTIQHQCFHCCFAYVCMSCAIQLNLVYLCNLSLFACSCVLWPSLTAQNENALGSDYLQRESIMCVCFKSPVLRKCVCKWECKGTSKVSCQRQHNLIVHYQSYSRTVSIPEGSSTYSMYQGSSGAYT